VVRGLARAIPPEKLPPDVRAFVELLHLDVVDEPLRVQPPGYKYPVWLIPVRDEGTGEVVGILNAYPQYEREKYAIITITNKLGRPVTVITPKEEEERVTVPKPKVEEVKKAIEEIEKEVPEKVITAEVDWKYLHGLANRMEGWVNRMRRHAEARNALSVYTYLKSMNEFLSEAKEKLAESDVIRKMEKREAVERLLTDEEYKKLWKAFSDALKKARIDPSRYRSRFEELVMWDLPYEDNEALVLDEARRIILEARFVPFIEEVAAKPTRFSWKYVEWGLGAIAVELASLKDAVEEKNVVEAYNSVRRMLDIADRLKDILRTSPDVKEFEERS
jgi:hypothetical protein